MKSKYSGGVLCEIRAQINKNHQANKAVSGPGGPRLLWLLSFRGLRSHEYSSCNSGLLRDARTHGPSPHFLT